MKQEIIDYYDGLNIPVSKMIYIGTTRRNLTAGAVKKAAAEVYEEIISGTLTIPQIRIAWEVFARAKHMASDEPGEIQKLKAKIKSMEDKESQKWFTKLRRWMNGRVE